MSLASSVQGPSTEGPSKTDSVLSKFFVEELIARALTGSSGRPSSFSLSKTASTRLSGSLRKAAIFEGRSYWAERISALPGALRIAKGISASPLKTLRSA